MKKLRVFQTVRIKRIVPGSSREDRGTVLLFNKRPARKGYWPLFLLMIPYLVTFLFGNLKEGEAAGYEDRERNAREERIFVCNTTGLGSERIPLEDYVADRLARTIDESYEPEALKAQAVLIRSGLLAAQAGEGGAGGHEIVVEDAAYGSGTVTDKIWTAVSQSAGVCLLYEGKPVSGAYFKVSNGATRNAGELLLTGYPYLKSVPCSRDFLSEDFTGMAVFTEGEFERLWQQVPAFKITEEEVKEQGVALEKALDGVSLYRDSVGYVLYLEWDGKFVSGEQFRECFHLASSSFHLDKEDGRIVVTVKGVGHGLGMSQFGANEMAKKGDDHVEILNYFFQDVIITKFE